MLKFLRFVYEEFKSNFIFWKEQLRTEVPEWKVKLLKNDVAMLYSFWFALDYNRSIGLTVKDLLEHVKND